VATRQRALVDVGALVDFPTGECRLVHVADQEIGIVRWHDGRVFAIRNHCPHQGGPICAGHVGPKLVGVAGTGLAVVDDEPVITCGWHHWEFELATGRSVWNERIPRLRTFPTAIADGRVLVELRTSS
jgi:nitrite reductase/ring-hydroxylating ferredoxin subunit